MSTNSVANLDFGREEHRLYANSRISAANIDVAVVGVTAEAVTTSGQFLVELVEQEVA